MVRTFLKHSDEVQEDRERNEIYLTFVRLHARSGRAAKRHAILSSSSAKHRSDRRRSARHGPQRRGMLIRAPRHQGGRPRHAGRDAGLRPEMFTLPTAGARKYILTQDANRASTRTKIYATSYESFGTPHEKVSRKTVTLVVGKEMHEIVMITLSAK